jgi:lipid-binding SYLF domain-containing protein
VCFLKGAKAAGTRFSCPAIGTRVESPSLRKLFDCLGLIRYVPSLFSFPNRLKRGELSGGKMKRTISALVLMFALVLPMSVPAQDKECDRVDNAGQVTKEIMDIPDDIPQNVIDKADCVVVLPSVLKAAFVVGGSYGRGVMTCRSGENFRGPWGAPTMMALEGGSFGFQIGVQATDFVLLLMNDRAASSILTSKVKLGGDASAAAGPVGRNASAETDVTMRAEVLSYSRARGLFAGVSLTGSTLRADNNANRSLYGKDISAQDIVLNGKIAPPACAKVLLETLARHSPKNLSGD